MTNETTRRTYRIEEVAIDDLSATDLRQVAADEPDAGYSAYRLYVYEPDGHQHVEAVEVMICAAGDRMGVAWGSDASWADVRGLDAGIDMYLNDGEMWADRN